MKMWNLKLEDCDKRSASLSRPHLNIFACWWWPQHLQHQDTLTSFLYNKHKLMKLMTVWYNSVLFYPVLTLLSLKPCLYCKPHCIYKFLCCCTWSLERATNIVLSISIPNNGKHLNKTLSLTSKLKQFHNGPLQLDITTNYY